MSRPILRRLSKLLFGPAEGRLGLQALGELPFGGPEQTTVRDGQRRVGRQILYDALVVEGKRFVRTGPVHHDHPDDFGARPKRDRQDALQSEVLDDPTKAIFEGRKMRGCERR